MSPSNGELHPLANATPVTVTVCGWTPVPDAYLKCIVSDPNGLKMDKKGLAFLSINCAWKLAIPVSGEFTGISKSTRDNEVKKECTQCEQILADSISSSDKAMKNFKNGNYEAAADDMANASDTYSACYGLAQKILALPEKFKDDSSTLKKYFLNSEAILYALGKEKVSGNVA